MNQDKSEIAKLLAQNDQNHFLAYYPKLNKLICKRKPVKRKKSEYSQKFKNAQLRFAAISRFASRNNELLIKPIWKKYNYTGSNAFNLFMKQNKHAFNIYGDIYDKRVLQMSIGDLYLSPILQVDFDIHKQLTKLSWEADNKDYPIKSNTDTLCYGVLTDNISLMPIYTEIKRKDKYGEIKHKQEIKTGEYIYFFWASIDKEQFSNSIAFEVK